MRSLLLAHRRDGGLFVQQGAQLFGSQYGVAERAVPVLRGLPRPTAPRLGGLVRST